MHWYHLPLGILLFWHCRGYSIHDISLHFISSVFCLLVHYYLVYTVIVWLKSLPSRKYSAVQYTVCVAAGNDRGRIIFVDLYRSTVRLLQSPAMRLVKGQYYKGPSLIPLALDGCGSIGRSVNDEQP